MTDENSITFRGTLNKDEYINEYWDNDTMVNKVNIALFTNLIGFILIRFGFMKFNILIYFIWFWIVFRFLVYIADKTLRKRLKTSFIKSFLNKEHLYTINRHGIERSNDIKSLFVKWNSISKITETDSTFKIYVITEKRKTGLIPESFFKYNLSLNRLRDYERNNSFIISKKFIINEYDLINFRSLIKENFNNKKSTTYF
ncbi:hypothetical protein K5V21_01285 [Clostridium sardiniense]|uniref:YcxB-like protein domain-containing protein n=1 Tax=Clostridium sardiniense TaxID=29369 RepID=A0ABS7KTD5_CLOSR|nr:hypothetical protein [Clostridium sardiniense]MBY0754078.1 hypothetical protein [Clostridium sardiniense]MDQ0459400.1 hypothetical protein [Clostridium sardiniense]